MLSIGPEAGSSVEADADTTPCHECGFHGVHERGCSRPSQAQEDTMNHREMALVVDYYRTALGWKHVFESGAELDEPRSHRASDGGDVNHRDIGSFERGEDTSSETFEEITTGEQLRKVVDGEADVKDDNQWVVYVLDQDGRPLPYFLAVGDSKAEAKAEMNNWWKAFDSGEKQEPRGYGGLSMGPVSDFEEWKSP